MGDHSEREPGAAPASPPGWWATMGELEPVRRALWPVAMATVALLGGYGVLTGELAVLWLGVVSAVLGIGGAEDFVAGTGLELSDRSLICLPSTYEKDGNLQSRIVPWFGPGAVITTPRHHVDVIVTEYGAAELEGRTVAERGEALAAIAHPQFRDELLAAAKRASNGRSPVE